MNLFMKYIITLVSIILFHFNVSFGQYIVPWSYLPQMKKSTEKSFEHTIYFFKPSYLNPYGIGGMGSVVSGFINEPLVNIQINPSYLVTDSIDNHYIYLDFRNNHNRVIEKKVYDWYRQYPPWYNIVAPGCLTYIPINSKENRLKRHEPIFAGAYLIRPFKQKFNRFTIGLTYHLIYNKERYHELSQNTYQSILGYNFAGISLSDSEYLTNGSKPNLNSSMRDKGHFLSLLSGLSLTERLEFAVRLSRVMFKRNGNYSVNQEISNDWKSTRIHNYNHWDLSIGFNYRFSRKITAGIMGGYLQGQVTQKYDSRFLGISESGTIDKYPEWSYYYSSYVDNKFMDHDGHTFYCGANMMTQLHPKHKLIVYYRHLRQHVHILLNSTQQDTSYINYYYETPLYISGSESTSANKEIRSGTGSQCDFSHRLATIIKWNVFRKTLLNYGFKLDIYNRKILTTEAISINKFSDSKYFDSNTDEQYHQFLIQKGRLEWNFKMNIISIQLPIFINHQFSDFLKMQFGFNTRLIGWWYDKDKTRLDIDTQEEQVSLDMDPISDFYPEKYFNSHHQTTRSDLTITVLMGVTFLPTKFCSVRFMMTPHCIKTNDGIKIRELQWWFNLNFFF